MEWWRQLNVQSVGLSSNNISLTPHVVFDLELSALLNDFFHNLNNQSFGGNLVNTWTVLCEKNKIDKQSIIDSFIEHKHLRYL